MLDLDLLATAMGVTIVETPQLRPDKNAVYIHHRRMILVRQSLDPWTRRAAVAHELGHAYYGHEVPDDPRSERRADEFAARLLINSDAYRAAETIHPSVGAIAHELGVTPHLVEIWRGMHERTRSL